MGAPRVGADNFGAVRVYGQDLPVGVLAVDAVYCAMKGALAFTGACIAAAIEHAERFPAAISKVVLSPGRVASRMRSMFDLYPFLIVFVSVPPPLFIADRRVHRLC